MIAPVTVYDDRKCQLGEGAFWHPERQQIFWFDIFGQKLMSRAQEQVWQWQFAEMVSAAGWVDHDTLLMASETALSTFHLVSQRSEVICPLEAESPATRSNDGRADPHGGFWIGTMGKSAEARAGAIYRYFQGQLTKLFDNITIPNSICFAPDGALAYFADTVTGQIMAQPLDRSGWPTGTASVFVDGHQQGLSPDGSVVDTTGALWNAQWGSSRVARYDASGKLLMSLDVAAKQPSCPAFGGQDMCDLFITSAAVDLGHEDKTAGLLYCCRTEVKGQKEHRVLL